MIKNNLCGSVSKLALKNLFFIKKYSLCLRRPLIMLVFKTISYVEGWHRISDHLRLKNICHNDKWNMYRSVVA